MGFGWGPNQEIRNYGKRTLSMSTLSFLLLAGALSGAPAAQIQRLEVFPPTLSLTGPDDARRLLVTGWTEGGERVDLTPKAQLEVPEGLLSLGADGYLSPAKNGEGEIAIKVDGLQAKVPCTVKDFEK